VGTNFDDSTPSIDGKYLRSPFLNLNNTPPNLKPNSVAFMIGVNRDEGGVLANFYHTDNLDTGIEDLAGDEGLNAQAIISSGDFPLGDGPIPSNQTLDVFNTTTRIYTDNSFRCTSQAIAYGGVKSGILPNVWFYEFNRTYQDPGYDMNGVCTAPKTASHPYGDPDMEYFKCHAGDLFFTFGTFVRSGLPYRDEHDEPFQHLVTDYWTSFGRTYDPNPDVSFLEARGYWDTIGRLQVAGKWPQVDAEDPQLMQLQYDPFVHSFVDDAQCAVINLPINYLVE
jgi:carboxylesterase type B